MLRYIELTLSALILAAAIALLVLIPKSSDGTHKDGDAIYMSTVKWGGVEASVPELIMRDMGLKPGQEIDDETAARLTEEIVRYFNLEAKKSGR